VPAGDLAVREAGGNFEQTRFLDRRQTGAAGDALERLLNQSVL
jgi:hypothetical protein